MLDVETKRNVFITGSAGSGKSYMLKECYQKLNEQGKEIKMCATTGIAASLVNGCTLNLFAGIGIGEKDAATSVKCLPLIKTEQWKRIETLFIDEISMLDSNYFELLNEVVKKVRESDKVFRALQLIVCGDFFQLVETWKKCQFKMVDLKTCNSQKDNVFVDVLHNMPLGGGGGILSQNDEKVINSRFVYTAPLHIPRLYFTNRECNDYNEYRLPFAGLFFIWRW